MLKRLVIWLMLIALPMQSFAAVTMLHCAPRHEAIAAVVHEHHASGMEGHEGHTHHHADADAGTNSQTDDIPTISTDKCSACSTCCMSSMAMTYPQWMSPIQIGAPVLVPHPALSFHSIILDGPQRPPRSFLA